MRCNACWQELEGRAITTSCGHLLCHEDARKIISNNEACPVCDQVLSKSHMKPVDLNPNDEWVNMAMAGISPQILMKSSHKSIMFYIGQKELEMQYKMNRIVAQCRQKCEAMQEKFTGKMEQVHAAYQQMAKRCQILEQENENLLKDKQELQEKFSEKSRQKRKLDEMYDQLRSELDTVKRSAIQPANNFFSRNDHDLFDSPANMMNDRDPMRKGPREDIWPQTRQNSSNSGPFDISASPPVKHSTIPAENRRPVGRPMFGGIGVGGGGGASNPSIPLRNLILSPMKRPQFSRNRPQLFTL
ncbi:E3 ubiquitin-protein ligase CCNB1IP1 homolog isoform X2 [Bidens hawaiensis]|uniref:E3 ubiquitin-protein ligase CCNB1IP1 homolog isoform X2 n=2 Tax=Bidens hawaiensis TaxID=980011 RepID=UPI00404AEDE9